MQSRIWGPILRSVFRERPSLGDIYYKVPDQRDCSEAEDV